MDEEEPTTDDAGVEGLLAVLRTAGGGSAPRAFPTAVVTPLTIGCRDPFGSKKLAVSGIRRVGEGITLALRIRAYGTRRIGLVGSAKHGGGGEDSTGLVLVGGEPLAEEDATVGAGGGGGGAPSLTTCLVLQ